MKTIVVASKNPVKIQAASAGFARMFPEEAFTLTGISAPSGVADQPLSNAETLRGAYNRARAARAQSPQADFWVGIEGGVEAWQTGRPFEPDLASDGPNTPATGSSIASCTGAAAGSSLAAFAWVVVLSGQITGQGRTGTFFLPAPVAELVQQGKELGEADDLVFGRTNSKQVNGAVGLLTGDVLNRAAFYEQAVILALIPFKNPALYPAGRPPL